MKSRKGLKRKKEGSPTFDGFDSAAKKKSVSHSADGGWNRCKSGFDDELIQEELISNSPWKVKNRKPMKAKTTSRGAKFVPVAASDLQVPVVGSEDEECIEEEPVDVDIDDWSSSGESNNNVSDVEPLQCDASPQSSPKKVKIRHEKVSASAVGTTAKGRKFDRPTKWLGKRGNEENVDIEEVKDDRQSEVQQMPSGKQGEEMVSQASTAKTEPTIDDYDSSDNDVQEQASVPSIGSEPSQRSTQISELTPSPTEDIPVTKDTAADTSNTQITGTQWMQKFIQQVESPEKDEGENVVGAAGDSARKKKKFIKSGLAERLQMILNREKSSIAFWNHQLNDMKRQPQDSNSTLVVEVLSMEHLQGLYVTRCNQLTPNKQSTGDETSTDTGDNQQQVYVLFSHNTGQNLNIDVGLHIRIYPPWQKLTLPNYSEPVILSTYFCQSLGHAGDPMEDEMESEETRASEMPSTSAMTLSPSKKPFHPLKLFEGLTAKPTSHTTPGGSLLESVTSAPEIKKVVSDSILDCIAESGAYGTADMCIRARVQRVYCKRIKPPGLQGFRQQQSNISSDHRRQWVMLLQDSHGIFCELQLPIDSASRPKWKDAIQNGEGKVFIFSSVKVVHRTNRSRSPGLFSLIDSISSPSDISIGQEFSSQSESDTEDWKMKAVDLLKIETDTLILSTTTTQGKEVDGLVTCLVKQLFLLRMHEDHALKVSKNMQGQNFCYTIGFQLGQGAIEEESQEDLKQTEYRLPHICHLQELSQEDASLQQRTSFYAVILHASPESNIELPHHPTSDSISSHSTGWHMVASDATLIRDEEGKMADERSSGGGDGMEYVYLHVRHGCVVNTEDWIRSGLYKRMVFCKDICVQQGGVLYADMYSAILKLDNTCQGCDRLTGSCQPQDGDTITKLSRVTIPNPPHLTNNSDVHTLVALTGTIIGVDESTAYSWPVCPLCGNDKLQGDESASQLMCIGCKQLITNPVTKMHLEVFVDCEASKETNTAVKVKLLQSTIESLLPPLSDQEEGYDMQCILGQSLQPTTCFLSNLTVLPSGDRCMELEEICVGDD